MFVCCRGLGSRSVLKRLKSGALVHDASYFGAVQLEGPEASPLVLVFHAFILFGSQCLVSTHSNDLNFACKFVL